MVDNVAGDDVESKPSKNEASGDVKPTVNVKPFKVKIPFHALALIPAHKLHRLPQNRFGISHTFHKFQLS